jgi:hypothetical protein
VIFLLRNRLDLTSHFAWFFFFSLVGYIVIGIIIMVKRKPGGRLRWWFLLLGPLWLIILTMFYSWGYLPYALVVPLVLRHLGLPPTLMLSVSLLGLVIPAGDCDGGSAGASTDDDDGPPKLKPPVIRSPIQAISQIGVFGIMFGTSYWVLNGLMPQNAKPGTVSYVFHKKTTHYHSTTGRGESQFVEDYLKRNKLEDAFDGQLRARMVFWHQQGLSWAAAADMARQFLRRSAPYALAAAGAGMAYYIGVAADLAEAETKPPGKTS